MLGLNPWPFALALIVFLAGAGTAHHFDAKKYDRLSAEYSQFKGGVEAVGIAQFKASERQAAADLNRKKVLDAQNRAVAAAHSSSLSRLRNELDAERSRRGGFVPAAPSGSKCPDGQACFDRTELERALRDFTAKSRGLVDEGSEVERDLNTAKTWTQTK